MPLLGAHVSIAGGLAQAIHRGEKLRCDAIQIFTQSSLTWQPSKLTETDITAFRTAWKEARWVRRVAAHNSYLLNLSTRDSKLRRQSVNLFIHILHQCEALGIESLITHPGSHRGAGLQSGIDATARSLNEVLKACPGFRTRILLENTAGQGDCIGSQFEELYAIVSHTRAPESIGFCFDTQHAFAAGYDLREPAGYEAVFSEWDRLLGVAKIQAFHLNDAVKGLGSRVDRHANIGSGLLGRTPFRLLIEDRRFGQTPMYLETAPGENDAGHKRDLRILRSFLTR